MPTNPGFKGPPLHHHAFDEAFFARRRAQRDGVEAPPWALRDIPEMTRVGPRIGEEA
jgi:hypothetical protein